MTLMKVVKKNKALFLFSIIASTYFLSQSPALASVTLGGTRFVYNASEDSLAVNLNNRDKNPYLVQSWVSKYVPPGVAAKKDSTDNIPFVVTPPLFKMDSGDSDILNIVKRESVDLPQDRESVFYLNVKAIPGKTKDNKSSLMISVDSSMKIFYRPEKLEGDVASSAWQKVAFSQSGNTVVASNPTPYFVTFYAININGIKIKLPQNAMIDPFGKLNIPVSGTVHSISWKTLGDQGQITSEKTVTL